MLWLALYCPTLPLDCILRRWPEGLEPALAVTDLVGTRRLIAVATRKAQACGVFTGQSIATALSLVSDLVLVARKCDDERAALAEAALAMLRFTPMVSLRASGLVLEISASLKLFGGHGALRRGIAATMRVQGLAVAAAEAPTPHGAWLLAQQRARSRRQAPRTSPARPRIATASPPPDFFTALDALPIAHLETARPSLSRLDGIGVQTLADLRRLPAKGLALRYGPELIDELGRAYGERPDPQIVVEAPSRFHARIELMAQVETSEALTFASQRLLAQMTGWLTARRAAIRGFTLVLHHDRWKRDAIEPTAIPIALATPSNDLSRLGTLVRERLSNHTLNAPVLELSLEAAAVVVAQEVNGSLFPAREQMFETLARLLEKLTARLGPEAMARLERAPDLRPERAWRAVQGDVLDEGHVNASKTGARAPKDPPQTDVRVVMKGRSKVRRTGIGSVGGFPQVIQIPCCGPRPIWLLSRSQQLEMRAHRPIYEALPLRLVAGPERIEIGWWDKAPATRDYFIGENEVGRLMWIYRERLPVEDDQAFWFLQGLFG